MSDEPKKVSEKDIDAEKRKNSYDFAWNFAQLQKQILSKLSDSTPSATYTRYSKENLLKYMQSPKANERNIRNASIYMYNASSLYRRLILYYAHMPLWAYTVSPIAFDISELKESTFEKSYLKAIHRIETMNIKHEMQKASVIAFREGVLYGVQWSNSNSFFIQRINPDICKLSSIVDGTWLYAVDFSKIKEEELELYPPEFTEMWNAYKNNQAPKWQEIPESISFCLKADETTTEYSIPPWASTLPMLYDIEAYKMLQETSSQISNYKLLKMEVPLDKDGNPLIDYSLAEQYYRQIAASVPSYIGVVMAPMKIESLDFERNAALKDVDTVARTEEQFWREGGTSPLLFGASDNNTAGALKLSILADEEIVFGIMVQAERLLNRILKQQSDTQKFKINILPATVFNKNDMIATCKEAASHGIPVKSAYSSLLGLSPCDIVSMDYIEMNLLNMGELTPLSSTYTQPSPGRPAVSDDELTESGEQTRGNDSNADR